MRQFWVAHVLTCMAICHMALLATKMPAMPHPMMRTIVAANVKDDPVMATKFCRILSDRRLQALATLLQSPACQVLSLISTKKKATSSDSQ